MSKSVNVDFVTRQIEVDTDGKEHFISAAMAAKDAEQSAFSAQNAATHAEVQANKAENMVAALPDNWQDTVDYAALAKLKTDGFVTPEMFGAVGDGIVDDGPALKRMAEVSNTYVFSKGKVYYIGNSINSLRFEYCIIYGNNSTLKTDREFYVAFSNVNVENLATEGLSITVNGRNSVFTNVVNRNSFKVGIQIIANKDTPVNDLCFKNCTVKNSLQYGWMINGNAEELTLISESEYFEVENIIFENCRALSCGRVKERDASGQIINESGSTWSPGFCIEAVLLADGTPKLKVKNIQYINCVSDDSLESGYHIEEGVLAENISYINCTSENNGIRKYHNSDIYTSNAVYTGANAITFGAGYCVTKSTVFINCKSCNNFRSILIIPSKVDNSDNKYPLTDFSRIDIQNANGYNYAHLTDRECGNIIFDSDIAFDKDLPYSNDNVHSRSYTISEFSMPSIYGDGANKKQLMIIDRENKAIAYNTVYDAGKNKIISFYPIKVNKHKKYVLKFSISAQLNSSSLEQLSNKTTEITAGLFDKNLHRVLRASGSYYVNNYISPPTLGNVREIEIIFNDETVKDAYANNTLFLEGTRYLAFCFKINNVETSDGHNANYDYVAPIIKNITLTEIDA